MSMTDFFLGEIENSYHVLLIFWRQRPTGEVQAPKAQMSSDVVPNVEPLIVPELPDPFLRDDSPKFPSKSFGYSSQITLSGPVMDVPLQSSETSSARTSNDASRTPTAATYANENKSLPKPEPDERPDLHIPGLVVSGLFLPVPNVSSMYILNIP